jgi:hypothetical protein
MEKYYHYLKFIDNINPENKLDPVVLNKSELNKIVGGRFISKEIQDEILDLDLYNNYSFEYKYKKTSGIINISIYKSDNIQKYFKELEIVSKILIFLAMISKKTQLLKAFLFLSKYEKTSNGSNFNPENINSGYTTFAMLDRYIVVYRREEYIKVLIHEAIHFFELDRYFNQFGNLQDYLPFKFNSNDIITEAFTDFYAINYYIIFISIYLNKKNYSDFKNIYQLQIDFIKQQAINIIILSKVNETNTINNNTNVFSYFVLKYILFECCLNKNLFKITKEKFKVIIDKMLDFIKNVPDKDINNIPLTMTLSHLEMIIIG